jgi:hypothetical protein
MAREKTATEQLNISLSALESILTVMGTMAGDDGPLPKLIAGAVERAEEIRSHLLTIQFHLGQCK